MIFPPHCKFLDIFSKLISNTIYKRIPFIIFLFALLAIKKTKFFKDTATCSRWWWFNFRSSHTWNRFLLWQFTINLDSSRLRKALKRRYQLMWKPISPSTELGSSKSLYLISRRFLVLRASEHFKHFIKQGDMLFAFISSIMK